jgi:hypothetical protein
MRKKITRQGKYRKPIRTTVEQKLRDRSAYNYREYRKTKNKAVLGAAIAYKYSAELLSLSDLDHTINNR